MLCTVRAILYHTPLLAIVQPNHSWSKHRTWKPWISAPPKTGCP